MTVATISLFRPNDLLAPAAAIPVAEPLCEPVSQVRSVSIPGAGASQHGVWHCTPGIWRRQVVQAEFCHFLSGEAIFRPDKGEPVHITEGAAVYFPPKSSGTWEILRDSQKIFIVFEEAEAAR
ncbi:cupin domain-containing protein [Sphingosinicella sp.]|uniref:cupin domain-containing protein n=1 Tax=Sphingosinicella sp. TaxID=1917971 RepID=UPI0035AFA1B8